MMRAIFFSVICVLCLGLRAAAQGPDSLTVRLALPTVQGASVAVRVHGEAAAAIERATLESAAEKVKVYRVGIFFDNSQDARAEWNATADRFAELFPDVPVHKLYENPYFKVQVGNCLSNEEAIILWGRVKGSFPKAYIMQEQVDMEELAR